MIISIHAPRTECDLICATIALVPRRFQSTHPMWSATPLIICWAVTGKFQSTHPMWSATALAVLRVAEGQISIHAPHVECDATNRRTQKTEADFNPRTPCGVRPRCQDILFCLSFQPTHPIRSATGRIQGFSSRFACFNPRTPCGVRQHRFAGFTSLFGGHSSASPAWGTRAMKRQ